MNFSEKFSMSKFASKLDRDTAIEVDWQFMQEELARVRAELKEATKKHKALSDAVIAPLADAVDEKFLYEKRIQGLRTLCGYVEDGTDTTIHMFQDDATKEWILKLGDMFKPTGRWYSSSFTGVIDAAIVDILD